MQLLPRSWPLPREDISGPQGPPSAHGSDSQSITSPPSLGQDLPETLWATPASTGPANSRQASPVRPLPLGLTGPQAGTGARAEKGRGGAVPLGEGGGGNKQSGNPEAASKILPRNLPPSPAWQAQRPPRARATRDLSECFLPIFSPGHEQEQQAQMPRAPRSP